ncbi:MAG: helix-turn-helix transcriptional regulator, partial [Adlercreutzia sp.]|nr:helix-turn-helix transcriptional regulator [Adlercreutzia sp.]
ALYLLCVVNQLVRGAGRQDARALDQVGRRQWCGPASARHEVNTSMDMGVRLALSSPGLAEEVAALEADSDETAEGAAASDAATDDAPMVSEPDGDEGVPAEIAAYCQDLAVEYGLTPREAEILALVALGRSAKYISEELTVSYNTTRTHVRHIYEKLNIHSKQELIDLVLFGSGVM